MLKKMIVCCWLHLVNTLKLRKNNNKKKWNIQTKCINFINKENITDDENENLANEMSKFTEIFPILFPGENITRKMHVFSLILPIFVRTFKMTHKLLKLEQATESLHHKLNILEQQNLNI